MSQAAIKILPKHVANQIAAGEVVERPASVVKELLENSLDAGANVLEIDIEKGGVRRIHIRDDGHGIREADLPLAITAHATSKLTDVSDLESLFTLGFRGEALASISAVAELSIQSKHINAESAWQFDPEQNLSISAHPQGTSIDVRNLFYNANVRRKFLKSERTEFQRIEEVVKRIALSRYDVAISLHHNGKKIIQLQPCQQESDYIQRVGSIVGNSFAKQAIAVQEQRAGLRLWGWLADARFSKAHADAQYFFLNGRMVRDKLLNHAIRSAYQDILPAGQYPAYVLYLELAPAQVDINVHPTKHEVRFCEPRLVHDFVQFSVQNHLTPESASVAETQSTEQPTYEVQETQKSYNAQANTSTASIHIRAVAEEHWVLYQQQQNFYILDFRAATKLLLAQQIKTQSISEKRLLLPVKVDFNTAELEYLLKQETKLAQYGITLRQVSANQVMMLQAPTCVPNEGLPSLLRDLAQNKTQWSELLIKHSVAKPLPSGQELLLQVQELLVRFEAQLLAQTQLKKLQNEDWQRLLT